MDSGTSKGVVHLELHTSDLPAACDFYARVLGWPSSTVNTPSGAYQALQMGNGLGGGVVECATKRAIWLPYVEVESAVRATELASENGARVLLSPREGPAGWRSVVKSPCGGELAFWQSKR